MKKHCECTTWPLPWHVRHTSGRLPSAEPLALHVAHAFARVTLTSFVVPQTASAAELLRFITTPRATQAMVRGAGVNLGRFKPAVHVTLWS